MSVPDSLSSTLAATLVLIFLAHPSFSSESEQYLTHPDPTKSPWQFGSAVACSGNTILVCSPHDRTAGSRAGAVYVYEHDEGAWQHVATWLPDPDVEDVTEHPSRDRLNFGLELAIQGSTAAVVCGNQDRERNNRTVYLYQKSSDGWVSQGQLPIPAGVSSFGRGLLVHADEVFVASLRQVRGYSRTSGQWKETVLIPAPDGDPYFGSAMAVTEHTLLISGASYDGGDRLGLVYSYARVDGRWKLEGTVEPVVTSKTRSYGHQIRALGNIAIISDYDIRPYSRKPRPAGLWGAAYLFERRNGSWVPTTVLASFDPKGADFARYLSLQKDFAIIGGKENAHLFQIRENGWAHTATLRHETAYSPVASSPGRVVIGLPDKNRVHVVERSAQFQSSQLVPHQPVPQETITGEQISRGFDEVGYFINSTAFLTHPRMEGAVRLIRAVARDPGDGVQTRILAAVDAAEIDGAGRCVLLYVLWKGTKRVEFRDRLLREARQAEKPSIRLFTVFSRGYWSTEDDFCQAAATLARIARARDGTPEWKGRLLDFLDTHGPSRDVFGTLVKDNRFDTFMDLVETAMELARSDHPFYAPEGWRALMILEPRAFLILWAHHRDDLRSEARSIFERKFWRSLPGLVQETEIPDPQDEVEWAAWAQRNKEASRLVLEKEGREEWRKDPELLRKTFLGVPDG